MLLFKTGNFEKKNKKLKMNFEGYREVHSEPCHTSKMEHFAKVVNALSRYLFLQNAYLRYLTWF